MIFLTNYYDRIWESCCNENSCVERNMYGKIWKKDSAVKGCFTQSVTAGFFDLGIWFFLLVTGHSLINCTVDESGGTFSHRSCMILNNRSAFRCHTDFHFYEFTIISGICFFTGLRQFPSGLFLFTHLFNLTICPYGRNYPKTV